MSVRREYPVTGFFGGNGKTRIDDTDNVYPETLGVLEWMKFDASKIRLIPDPEEKKAAVPIKTAAVRWLDMIQSYPRYEAPRSGLYPAIRWLELKGYIRKAEWHQDHPIMGEWVYDITDEGQRFYEASRAPLGEW